MFVFRVFGAILFPLAIYAIWLPLRSQV